MTLIIKVKYERIDLTPVNALNEELRVFIGLAIYNMDRAI